METLNLQPSSSSSIFNCFSPSLPHKHALHFFRTKSSASPPPSFHSQTPRKFFKKPPFKSPAKNVRKFKESDAFPMSLPIQGRNPFAIYSDIQRFAEQNKLKEALAILDYMDQRGIPVNPTTFSSLIAACVRLKALAVGRKIHVHIRINGLQCNEFLQTKLVHMYSACGSIEDARKVFDEIPSRSVYAWNALLRGNVILGGRQYGEVLHTFGLMRELGIELNVYSFSCVIKSFAGAKAFNQGLKTHGILVKNGLGSSKILRTSLMDMYFKCGKPKLAHRVFEESEVRDVVAWGAMIAGFSHNRLQREALEYTRWMVKEGVEVNSAVITMVLPVIAVVRAKKLGQEVHAYVIKTKHYSNQLSIQSALVDMYCKCGDMVSGRTVFYGSAERNAISWTALLSGYVSNGRLDQALRSIEWMQQEGFKPDTVTIATVLPVCGKLRALKHGKELHGYAVKNGFLPNVSIATSLMMMYSKCGLLEYSIRVFDKVEFRNVISWTAMIESNIESGCLHEALGVFRLMQLSQHRPDTIALSRMLSVCSGVKALKLGMEIHGQILKREFGAIPYVSAEVIKMYGACGAKGKAKLSFDIVPIKGSMTWTAIIEAYGSGGFYQEAIDLFKQMISDGASPSHFTFEAVLCICDQAGFADEACKVFNLITRTYKIKATEKHYTSIINLLSRYGRDEEAQRFVQLRSAVL
ncbi:hypothetical protein DCAR_0418145 [Daucus carota subsp. sativus]|uniref:Pentacotripeptide-repeat region of PRORP domain-containing protein n=2 Tax=Daucus carota subsp. sativus TaxID=79200 RepID=A0A162AEH3_DAUCS|nr:hypothetical protein DCAR_0418145 [Daucus carota subsp. sativus]